MDECIGNKGDYEYFPSFCYHPNNYLFRSHAAIYKVQIATMIEEEKARAQLAAIFKDNGLKDDIKKYLRLKLA